jgi:hypothetical protein
MLNRLNNLNKQRYNNTLFNMDILNNKNNNVMNNNINNSINNITNIINNYDDNLNPFKIFNEDSIRNLGVINRFIIKPTYEALKNEFENTFNNSIELFKLIYIIILSIFISLIFISYIFLWKPFEQELNSKVINYSNN